MIALKTQFGGKRSGQTKWTLHSHDDGQATILFYFQPPVFEKIVFWSKNI